MSMSPPPLVIRRRSEDVDERISNSQFVHFLLKRYRPLDDGKMSAQFVGNVSLFKAVLGVLYDLRPKCFSLRKIEQIDTEISAEH